MFNSTIVMGPIIFYNNKQLITLSDFYGMSVTVSTAYWDHRYCYQFVNVIKSMQIEKPKLLFNFECTFKFICSVGYCNKFTSGPK
jgi:hypothetical protein